MFSKTFDTLEQDVLFNNLVEVSITGKLLNIISSMYNKVHSYVKTANCILRLISVRDWGVFRVHKMFLMFINKLI